MPEETKKEEQQTQALAQTHQDSRLPQRILEFSGFSEAAQAAKMLAGSALVPSDYRGKPQDVMLCWQYGAEVGLHPMQAMQSIAIINGKPGLYADGLLAVAMSHPEFVDIIETGDARQATCTIKRRGRSDTVCTFTMEQAQRAGLTSRGNVWKQYPERMLQMRARGFALRDAFADALKGFKTVEELRDYPNATVQADPAGPPPASDSGGVIDAAFDETSGATMDERTELHEQIKSCKTVDELQQCKPGEHWSDEHKAQAREWWKARKAKIEHEQSESEHDYGPPPWDEQDQLPEAGF